MAIKFKQFSGVAPALTKYKLPQYMAQTAVNVNLESRTIKPWKDAITVLGGITAAPITTIFRFGRTLISDIIYWFTWNKDVDVVKGSVIGDTTERTFYTGDGQPRWTNATLATVGGPPYPADYRILGVTGPTTAPVMTVTGAATSTDYVEVGYAYTRVTPYGEESAPSPICDSQKVYQGQVAQVGTFEAPLSGKESTVANRIYRAVTDVNGNTNLYFVKEVGTTGSYPDDVGDNIGELCQTSGWRAPPTDGFGITSMANGIMLVFSGSDIYPSAQYAPYAYPLAYRMSCDWPIVGGAAIGTVAIVFTYGNPYLISGLTPDALKSKKIETPEVCISKRSIVNASAPMPSMMQSETNTGVIYYASQNGLCSVDVGGAVVNLTKDLLNRADWQALNPSSIKGSLYNGRYFGFFNTGAVAGGFCFDPNDATDRALSFFQFNATGAFFDLAQDHLMLQVGTNIVLWNASSTNLNVIWRSGVFDTQECTWAFARVRNVAGDYSGTTKFRLYGDGNLLIEVTATNDEMFRVPGDDHYDQWEIEIESNREVYEVGLATSGKDARLWPTL